ncbi:MAG: LytTR family DNA-binding domain-containing protein [Flavobacteriaceae bacterium]|nr:LytTR family DNA-binding domain-containing protein [Flavobacteriaceae bacterium]
MVQAIIIEDEIHAFNHLNNIIINNYSDQIKIIGTADSVKSGIELIETNKPELVFLDIQINGGTGFDILDYFNKETNFEIIFTTGLIDYKEKSMDYFAFYYLNKPIQENQFIDVINKYFSRKSRFNLENYLAFKHQVENNNTTIAIPIGAGDFKILKLEDITYCEADGSYTTFHTIDFKSFLTSHNLAKFENLFTQSTFSRVHRSTLLNLKHVKDYSSSDGKVILTNGQTIHVSTRNKSGFMKMLKMMNYSLD